MARSSLMESQSQLRDAVDKRYITEETRAELDALAEAALEEVTGLMEYLQSPEALRNARRARGTPNRLAPRTAGQAQAEQGTANPERRTRNPERRTRNPEPQTRNPERR